MAGVDVSISGINERIQTQVGWKKNKVFTVTTKFNEYFDVILKFYS